VTVIRRNPVATVGLAAIILGIVGVATTVLQLVLRHGLSGGAVGGLAVATVLLDLLGQVVLTGLLTMVIGRAVLGEEVSIGRAWNLVRGRFAALLGVTLLTMVILIGLWVPWGIVLIVLIAAGAGTGVSVAWGILGGLATLVIAVLAAIRLGLAAPVTVLEGHGPWTSLRRSWDLTRRSFWRIFGILLLTVIVVGLAAFILEIPFDILSRAIGGGGTVTPAGLSGAAASASVAGIIVGGIGGIIANAIVRPVSSGVIVLLYLDMRMRKEGLDLALRNAAQNRQLTGAEFAALWQPPAAGPPGGAMAGSPPPRW
jgi:hypothetical protein